MVKYEITGITHPYNSSLHRIKALRDIPRYGIKAGDLGGYVQSESNLSQEGNCWVYGNARVYGDAKVFGDAEVYGNAEVYGDAKVFGNAEVYGNARVSSPSDILTIFPIGSRAACLTILRNKTCRTGCFYGTVDEFLAAVQTTHGDNKYAKQYRDAIDYAYKYFDWKREMISDGI